MKSLKITALSLVLVLLLAACGAKNDTPDEPAVDPTPEPPIEQPVEKTPDERINDIIADMSIEEKVGQLFFVRCPETGAAEDVETYHLGGLLLFGNLQILVCSCIKVYRKNQIDKSLIFIPDKTWCLWIYHIKGYFFFINDTKGIDKEFRIESN